MARFRASGSHEPKPESPALLFRDLKGKDRSVKFLWEHQGKLLDDYHKGHLDDRDVAVELPTGSGKTLVGMLIAEFRRRAKGERVVFLCPNKQLCCQVEAQARKYGITASLLIGKQKEYDPGAFSRYQQGKAIAISTYSGLFNSNPAISDPQAIICDDAHAADSFVSDMWTLRVDRSVAPAVFDRLYSALRGAVPEWLRRPIEANSDCPGERSNVDLAPSVLAADLFDAVRDAMDEVATDTDLVYRWRVVGDHLDACHIYCSPGAIEVRPVIPPTLTHPPFAGANQRLYMSATLGENGDIERSFGVKKIQRLPIPKGWDKRGTGRRLVFFPNLSADDPGDVLKSVLGEADRSLVLVPHGPAGTAVKQYLPEAFELLGPKDIEQDIKVFTGASKTVLLLANRYDGLDLPGEDCRMLAVVGLPAGSGLQERYLIERLGAISQFQNRIRTRVTQAMGRCTRDEGDYSVVLFVGNDLLKWCCTAANVNGMHPELQAEIRFGLEESEDRSAEDVVGLAREFLGQTAEWQEAEAVVQAHRDAATKRKDATTEKLAQAAPHEIDYVYKMWNGQYEDALKASIKVAEALEGGADLKPYRSFWYELAAQAAYHAYRQTGNQGLRSAAATNIEHAAGSSVGLKWTGPVMAHLTGRIPGGAAASPPTQDWFLALHDLLEEVGLVGGRFARDVAIARNHIRSTDWKRFEIGVEFLGRLLGGRVQRFTAPGKPDGFWLFDGWFSFVFEAKTMEGAESGVSMKTVGQAAMHEKTVRSIGLMPPTVPCATIVVSPRTTLDKLAKPHAQNLWHVSHKDMVALFEAAAEAFGHVRSTAGGSSHEVLRENFMRVYKERGLAMDDVRERLRKVKLVDLPVSK